MARGARSRISRALSFPRTGEAGTRVLLRVAAGLIAFGMGCGEGTAPPAPVATVVLAPATSVDLVVNGTDVIQAIPRDAAGNSLTNRIVEWSSSDPSKVTVAAGVVTGVTLGNATITATIEGHTASEIVSVKEGAVVSPTTAATFSAQNSAVTVSVPAGALTQTRNITVAPAQSPPPNDRLMPGTAFEFGPNGITFSQPVTLTIKYDPSNLTGGSPEAGLQLYEVVGTSWRVVAGSSANLTTHTVTGNVSHFTVYGVLMQPRVETIAINRDTTVQARATVQFSAALKDNEQQPLTRPVTWTSSSPAIVSLDLNGLATALLPGQSTITATSEGKSATATVTVVPGPPAILAIVAGDGQSVAAGSAVPTLPAVKVTDAFGNAISGFAINFAVASGGGAITGAAATTNASGVATVGSWTLGTSAGPNTLTATGTGLTPATVTFTAAAGAGAPTTVVAFAGNNQTATAGAHVVTPPSVKVTDANGNAVSGFTVVFAPAAGSGTVTGGSATTNSSGIAAVGSWTLGPTPGAQSLTATASGLTGSPITFAAIAVAPVPARIVLNAGDGQTATTGNAVATPPSVKVVDAADIPVPGFTVTFAVASGGGSITGASAVTNVNGFANVGSWVLGGLAGTNTLTATATGLQGSPVIFAATAVAAPPVAMAINAGDGQNVTAGTAVPVRPSVLVTDAQGRGVSGVTVTFSLRSGNGSITGTTPATDASGIATLGSWTLGLGGNSLFAQVPGLAGSPLVFVASGTARVQVVTFGDSNTDFGFSGNNPNVVAASYVSNNASKRLAPDAPNNSVQLTGKIESRWVSNRPAQTIRVVNHGIAGTTTGTGRNILLSPNARQSVGGVTRFEGEAMAVAYPWSGGESVSARFPSGPILRVQSFVPRTSDFLYISMGTNDLGAGLSNAATVTNLEWMVDQWIALGLPANHIIVTTLPPRQTDQSATIPALNSAIRAKFGPKGVRLIDIAAMTSNDDGLTWKDSSWHVGDSLHYAEKVRDMIADIIVTIMLQQTPP